MKQLIFRDKQIFYRVAGSGKPVIFIHGFGEDGRIWDNISKNLTGNYKVVVPDLPGSGQSQMLDGPCSIKDYADAVRAIAKEEFTDEPFTLIGHSMGGYITMAYADEYADELNALGLFHSSPYSDTGEKKDTRKKNIEFVKKNGAEAFFKTTVPDLFCELSKKEKPELIEHLNDIATSVDPQAVIQYTEAMMERPDRSDVLEKFNKPVFIIIGKSDPVIPLQISLKFCSLPSIAAVHILKKSGHEGMLEEPELSVSYIKEFLERFV